MLSRCAEARAAYVRKVRNWGEFELARRISRSRKGTSSARSTFGAWRALSQSARRKRGAARRVRDPELLKLTATYTVFGNRGGGAALQLALTNSSLRWLE